MIGTLSLHLRLPGCRSLKEKRGRIKPLIHRLHREFNVSVAEMDLQDAHQETVICCAMVGSDGVFLRIRPADRCPLGGSELAGGDDRGGKAGGLLRPPPHGCITIRGSDSRPEQRSKVWISD